MTTRVRPRPMVSTTLAERDLEVAETWAEQLGYKKLGVVLTAGILAMLRMPPDQRAALLEETLERRTRRLDL